MKSSKKVPPLKGRNYEDEPTRNLRDWDAQIMQGRKTLMRNYAVLQEVGPQGTGCSLCECLA